MADTAAGIAIRIAEKLDSARHLRAVANAHFQGSAGAHVEMDNVTGAVAALLRAQVVTDQILCVYEEIGAATLDLLAVLAERTDVLSDMVEVVKDLADR